MEKELSSPLIVLFFYYERPSVSSLGWGRKQDLLVVHPGGAQGLLELGEAHDVDVDELHHLVALGGAAGLVPHHLAHDPGERGVGG